MINIEFPTITFFTCLLYKNGIPKRYFKEVFLTKGEANLFASEYLNLRDKKKLSIKIVEHTR